MYHHYAFKLEYFLFEICLLFTQKKLLIAHRMARIIAKEIKSLIYIWNKLSRKILRLRSPE